VRRRVGGPHGRDRLARQSAAGRFHDDRRACRSGRARGPGTVRRPWPRRDPDLRHDGCAEGRFAPPAALARPGGGFLLADPAARRPDNGDLLAAVSLVGLRQLHARPRALLDARAPPPLRARAGTRLGRALPGGRADPRAGDAPADPRARARDDPPLRHSLAADRRRQWLGATGRARAARDGHLRRRALQPLRLDRGRLGDDPQRPARPARRHTEPGCVCSTSTAGSFAGAARPAASSSTTRWSWTATRRATAGPCWTV
jgi:hypothetical protein